ncbi:MAG TPA: FRG domain-containing protein [Gaiellaceae bacterium]|nr:FRG domain-containing protein [Gaiellaceae bacterium]HZU20407.1 FRG domain-containing protein [Gaiellaceae bacterium]
MEEIRAESWSHLHELLFAGSWHERLRRHRSDFAYRGEASTAAKLVTSLQRLGGDFGDVERHLLRNFRKYAPRSAVPEDSLWHWLALAKHHGLATRLLDWTFSPYVALHFATAHPADYEHDGFVWMVDFVKANRLLPEPLREALEREGMNAVSAELLHELAPTLGAFDGLGEDVVVFFEPPALDERIVNQYALFSLMPSPHARMDTWLEARPELARRVILPAELKWEVRDKLDQANITERVLFPGLDGLATWLKRYFSPRSDGSS